MLWLLVPAALALAVPALAYVCYCIAFRNPPPHREDIHAIPAGEQYQHSRDTMLRLIDEMDAIPFEQVTITSYDGTRLSARYYHVRDSGPVQIQMHGYRGSAIRDFCGGNKLAREAGINTLVPDQRAHGKSDGKTIAFGLRERYDCLAWVRFVRERFGPDTPVTLAGVSMGASTVLMAAGLDLPDNVKGVIADCPYDSSVDIIKKVCRDCHLPPRVFFPLIVLGGRLFGGFDIRQTTVSREIAKARVPVLILHGEDDRFVPCAMSRSIYKACPTPKLRVTFPGAGHALSYIVDPALYRASVDRFLEMIDQPGPDPQERTNPPPA